MIKEFDYKNYQTRYSATCGTVFCALLGAHRAERELFKNGMKNI
jgi:hypothetical protein